MKTPKLLISFLMALLASLASAQESNVVSQVVNGTWVKTYGPSLAGGELRFDAHTDAAYDLDTGDVAAYANGILSKRLRLLTYNASVATLTAEAMYEDIDGVVDYSHEYKIKLLNVTAWLEIAETASVTLPPLNILPGNGLSYAVPVGPFAITVRANAGLRNSMNFGATLVLTEHSVQLSGYGQAWALGTASAGISVGVASAGIQADLRFGNLRATVALAATEGEGTGTLEISLQPVTVKLSAFVQINLPFIGPKKWVKKLLDWGCAPIVTSIALQ